MNLYDTIAAQATPHGTGAIAVIRVSGEDAADICDKIFSSSKGLRLTEAKSHTLHYGKIIENGAVVDEALVSVFRAPASYTGENSVEISCHGGVLVSKRVLDAVLAAGARLAEPGEFTKRAFLNGRLDLSQAEGVIDVINAESTAALSVSVHQLGGAVSEKISEIRALLLSVIAEIDVAVDYPEEDIEKITAARTLDILRDAQERLSSLIGTADSGRLLSGGINTVIAGRPNVGKSSLLNALLGCDRAIVTELAGTTRDVISERLVLGNAILNICDTAGIRSSEDKIESFGIEKSREYIKNADLVLLLVDLTAGVTAEDIEIADEIKGKQAIIIANKADLAVKSEIQPFADAPVVYVSAKTGAGIDALSAKIEELFGLGKIAADSSAVIVSLRHKKALGAALSSVKAAIDAILRDTPPDLAAIDIQDAISALGEISGQTVNDEIVNEIFSHFCLGK